MTDVLPLVSCIMPTKDRRAFAARAIGYFLRQDYPNRELIIVDDGHDRITDLAAGDERIRYVPVDRQLSLGAKRNLACEHAKGSLIAHWDDDDWHAPRRLTYQATTMLETGADMCGTDRLLFYDPARDRALEYVYPRSSSRWLAGGTLCYRRDWWRTNRFGNIHVGEDSAFVSKGRTSKLVSLADHTFYVATIHAGNTSPKHTSGSSWRPFPADELRHILGEGWPVFAAQAHPEALGGRAATPQRPMPTRTSIAPRAAATELPLEPRDGRHRATGREAGPCVTVSIPYYRARPYIVQAVESILAQTHRDLRVVVINDGDPEPPWDLLAHIHDTRLVTFELPANRGRYFADAVVLEATPDSYFVVQDADDWSDPERISRLLAELRQTGSVAAVSGGWIHSGSSVRPGDNFPARGRPLTPNNDHRLNHIGLFDVAALRSIGGNYGGERLGYDTIIGNYLLMVGEIAYVDRPLYHRRMIPGSLSLSPVTGLRSKTRAAVWPRLHRMYAEAFSAYQQHRSGGIDGHQLASRIRAVRDARVSYADRAMLSESAGRLRAMLQARDRRLAGATTTSTVRAQPVLDGKEPRLSGDPRLTWTPWTITPTLAGLLEDRLDQSRPERVLEMGSGTSTAILAGYAHRTGATVTSLEHNPAYFARTSELLDVLGLGSDVDLRLAPIGSLTDPAGATHPRYSTTLDGPYDFVLVDGPPMSIGRDGALFATANHLAPAWELWLHDGLRDHERRCLDLWRPHTPFEARLHDIDSKGLWILRPPGIAATEVRQTLRTVTTTTFDRTAAAPADAPPEAAVAIVRRHAPASVVHADRAGAAHQPLVSCVMPTFDRRPFVAHALTLFDRQDYPNRELIVVDDGSDPVDDLVRRHGDCRYIRVKRRTSIGEKRNIACEAAHGDIVVCWDDDDWYAPGRISRQVEPLIAGRADAVGLTGRILLDLPTDQFWEWSATLHRRMFEGGLISGTLAFVRRLWLDGARFPDAFVAEDAGFQRSLVRRGAKVEPLIDDEAFIYVRHGANSWQFDAGTFLDRHAWQRIPRPTFLTADDVAAVGRLRTEVAAWRGSASPAARAGVPRRSGARAIGSGAR